MSEQRTIPLSAILGRSHFNVRPDGDADGRAAMAASIAAIDQLQALIVRAAADHADLYEVDDGGCRWDAMRLLVDMDERAAPEDREPWTWNTDVNVLVVNGDAGVARERSLAANVVRRQLHPVEECEAFAALVADGLSIATVAADFGCSTKYVRQRLKLDELSPRARAAWRAGHLSAEAAGVVAGAGDHAEQDAILDRFAEGQSLSGYNLSSLRAELRRQAVRGDDREAVYVGAEAYVAAGGRLDEQLFDTAPLFLDPRILKTLAAKKLMDFGLELAERHGFGSVVNPDELPPDERWTWGSIHRFTQADHDERRRLADEQDAALDALPPDADQSIIDEIEDHYEALQEAHERRAIERDTTPAQRAASAIFVSLNAKGVPIADFGRTAPQKTVAPAKPPPRPFVTPTEPETAAEPAEPARIGKALITILDGALSEGFAVLVQQHPATALILATAALTTRRTGDAPVRLGARHWNVDDGDRPLDWPAALAAELAQPQDLRALLDRFARAVASTIAVDPGKTYGGDQRADPHQLAAMAELVAHSAGADDYAEVMWDVLDYDAYFGACTRAATLAAIEDAGGVLADARKIGKADLAAMAAHLCTDRRWLPRELRMPAAGRIAAALPAKPPHEAPSLADAMAEALQADGEDLDAGAASSAEPEPLTFDPQTPEEAVKLFLDRHCPRDVGSETKASVLYDAFRARMPPTVVDLPPTQPRFARAIALFGIAKRRTSDGFQYLDLSLQSAADLKQAAE